MDYFVLASAFIERGKNEEYLQYYVFFFVGLKVKKQTLMLRVNELHYVGRVRG